MIAAYLRYIFPETSIFYTRRWFTNLLVWLGGKCSHNRLAEGNNICSNGWHELVKVEWTCMLSTFFCFFFHLLNICRSVNRCRVLIFLIIWNDNMKASSFTAWCVYILGTYSLKKVKEFHGRKYRWWQKLKICPRDGCIFHLCDFWFLCSAVWFRSLPSIRKIHFHIRTHQHATWK